AGSAQFICKSAIDHGARDDHAADGQGGAARCRGARTAPLLEQAAFEDADHGFEDGFESALGADAAASDVGGEGDHGAGVLDVLVMLAREIGADDLRANVGRGKVDVHAFPATFPLRVSEEATEDS